MTDWTPFVYRNSEQQFIQRLCELMKEEVVLPTDGLVHQVQLVMNIQCHRVPNMGGSFLLGSPDAS